MPQGQKTANAPIAFFAHCASERAPIAFRHVACGKTAAHSGTEPHVVTEFFANESARIMDQSAILKPVVNRYRLGSDPFMFQAGEAR